VAGPRLSGPTASGLPGRSLRRRPTRRVWRDHPSVVPGEVRRRHDAHRGEAMTIRVLDPRVDPQLEPLALAPATVLDGATIGLLDNAKIGTAHFYDHLEDLLRKHGVREFIRRR